MIEKLNLLLNRKLVNKTFTISIPVKLSLTGFIYLILTPYLIWELYWYHVAGLAFIKWHTHLMLYAYLAWAGVLIFRFWYRRNPSEQVENSFLLYNSLLFIFFFLECIFVLFGFRKTTIEEQYGYYISPSTYNADNYYNTYLPGKEHWLTTSEWHYSRPANTLGFSDKEWRLAKKPKEKRILVLGDSFTEGDGAPYDSNYVSLLQSKFTADGDSVYVMNAGTCSSDPFFNYVNLKDRLLKYKPDIVIQTLRTIDLEQYYDERGGFERFQQNHTIKYAPAPFWEPLYAISYLSRAFFAISDLVVAAQNRLFPSTKNNNNVTSYQDLFAKYSSLCKANGIQLIVVLHPGLDEVQMNKYHFNLHSLIDPMLAQNKFKSFDLLQSFETRIKKDNARPTDYYWQSNTHHNPRGYDMMADILFYDLNTLWNDTTGAYTTAQ